MEINQTLPSKTLAITDPPENPSLQTQPPQQQEQQQLKRRRYIDKHSTVNGRHRRVRIPVTCCPGIFRLTQELGHRSDGDTIQWLLSQVRPELVLPPQSNNRTRRLPPDPVPQPNCRYPGAAEDGLDHKAVARLPSVTVRATVVQASTVFFDTPATLGSHFAQLSQMGCFYFHIWGLVEVSGVYGMLKIFVFFIFYDLVKWDQNLWVKICSFCMKIGRLRAHHPPPSLRLWT